MPHMLNRLNLISKNRETNTLRKLVFLFCFAFSTFTFAKEMPAYQIYSANGKSVDYEKMLKGVESKQFIFFGEYHDHPIVQWLQFEFTKDLHYRAKKNLVL